MKYCIPKEYNNSPGIYVIRSTMSEKIYIGSAYRLRQRFLEHMSRLERKKHHSRHLQRHCNKHGIGVFEMYLLSECRKEELLRKEQWYITIFLPAFNGTWNVQRPTLGMKASKELREKLSQAAKKRPPMSKETRDKISTINKGRIPTPEHRKNLSMAQKGKRLTSEHRLKLSEAAKNRKKECHITPHSEETKNLISQKLKGKKTGFDHHLAIRIKHKETGEIFPSIKAAAQHAGIKYTTLRSQLLVYCTQKNYEIV